VRHTDRGDTGLAASTL